MLEDEVDNSFYLTQQAVSKLLMYINSNSTGRKNLQTVLMNRNEIYKETDIAATLMARDYKGFGNQLMNGVIQNSGGTDEPKIIVAGSLNPDKQVQDRVRVLSDNGICQGLRATDYKDPPKIVQSTVAGIYLTATSDFQHGPLLDVSRTLKAEQNDAGVLLYGD